MRIRIPLPGNAEASAFGVAFVLHAALLVAIVGIGRSATTDRLGPAMTVRLAGPRNLPPRGGVPQGTTAPRPAPEAAPAETPAPRVQHVEPVRSPKGATRRLATEKPLRPTPRPSGATAQPAELPTGEPEPEPDVAAGPATAGPEAGGAPSGLPGLPEGPIAGGIAGLDTSQLGGADWYAGLLVTRLHEAWRDRPVLPAGSDPRRTVVSFVIERDGRVTEIATAEPSGYTLLDTSALRAVGSLRRLPPLPPQFRGDRLRARYVFELLPPG